MNDPIKNPDWDDKLNFIWDMFWDTCDAPFTLWLTTFFQAFLILIIKFFALDLLQAFTGFVRPNQPMKLSRGARHGQGKQGRPGKRTKKRAWNRWTSFDPSDTLGKKLGVPFGLPGREVTPGVGALWNIYGVIERVQYKFFIMDLGIDFFYNWMVLLRNTEYCKAIDTAIAVGRDAGTGGSGILDPWPFVFDETVKARGGAFILGDGGTTNTPQSTAAVSGRLLIANPADGPFVVKLFNDEGRVYESQEIRYPGGLFAMSGADTVATVWHAGVSGTGFWTCQDVEITVVGIKKRPPPPNWWYELQDAANPFN